MNDKTTANIVQALKVLSDSTRFELLKALLTRDLCVGALARRLGISEAAASQHLAKLREAGFVRGEKRGYWTHYVVEPERLSRLAGALIEMGRASNCTEEACVRQAGRQIIFQKEGTKMCDCGCQHPEKLKSKIGECSPEQIKECHGEQEKPSEKDKKQ